jgi:hypothetical protein
MYTVCIRAPEYPRRAPKWPRPLAQVLPFPNIEIKLVGRL